MNLKAVLCAWAPDKTLPVYKQNATPAMETEKEEFEH